MLFLKIRFSFLLSIFSISLGVSQQIEVRDAFSQKALPNVAVVNQNNSRYTATNENGTFDLETFTEEDTLHFHHMGYENKLLPFSAVKNEPIVSLNFSEKKLSEIILSVARTASKSKKIAEKVSIIGKNEIIEQQPNTGAALLALDPGVRIQKSQGGGGSPALRGFEANRVLLVVDGIRMNNAIYRSGHLQNAITIDPNTIERVEIVYGSSSVGYGSDALGGVVHYFTASPKINNPQKNKINLRSSYQSAYNAYVQNISSELSFKNWGSYTSLSHSRFGDLRMGKNRSHGYETWGLVPQYSQNTATRYFENPSLNRDPNLQKNIGYDQWDFMQKFLLNLPKEKQLGINFQFSKSSDIPRFDKLNELLPAGTLKFAEWRYGPQLRVLFSPQLKLFPKKKWLYKGNIIAGVQYVEESRIERKLGSLSRKTQNENVNVLSLNGDFESAKTPKGSLSYGFEWLFNTITSTAFEQDLIVNGNAIVGLTPKENIATRYPSEKGQYSSGALYGNYRWDINPKTTLSFGGRYTATHLIARWDNRIMIDPSLRDVNVNNNALTGSFSVTYRPLPKWQLNFLVSSGFRSPNIDDLGKIRENKGILLLPNTSLKPEYVYNLDVGVLFQSQDKKLAMALRGYNSSLIDYIGRAPYLVRLDSSTTAAETLMFFNEEVTTQANTNLGNARIYGASFEGKWKMTPSFSSLIDFTYTAAQENAIIGPLPSILPYFGTLGLHYTKEKYTARLNYRYSSSKAVDEFSLGGEDGLEETPVVIGPGDAPVFAGLPSWGVLDLTSSLELNQKIKLNIGLENLFDTHYRAFASGISSAGRRLNLGLNMEI